MKNAASDDVAFDLGEPEFNLVKPGRVGGCEVEVHPPILLQKLMYQLGFMSRQIIQDAVNLLMPWTLRDDLLEERDEIAAGVASRSLAVNPAGGSVQGGVQRQRSGSTRTRGVQHVRERAAEPDPGDPAPGWLSSHPRRTRPHAGAGSCTAR